MDFIGKTQAYRQMFQITKQEDIRLYLESFLILIKFNFVHSKENDFTELSQQHKKKWTNLTSTSLPPILIIDVIANILRL